MTKRDREKLEIMLKEVMRAAYEDGCTTSIYQQVYAIADAFGLDRRIIGNYDDEFPSYPCPDDPDGLHHIGCGCDHE